MSKNFIIFGASFLGAAGLSFWFLSLLKKIITYGEFDSQLILRAAIIFTVWLVVIAINLMMSFRLGGLIMAAALPVAFIIIFGFGNPMLIFAAMAVFVISIIGFGVCAANKSQRLKLSIASAKNGVNLYFIAALIIITVLSYQSIFEEGQLKVSEKNIKSLMPFIESQIKTQLPFYSSDMTTDEILVVSAISKQEISLSTKNFSPSLQREIQAKIAQDPNQKPEEILQDPEIMKLIIADIIRTNPRLMDELREDYGQSFGINIAKGQSLTVTLTDIVNLYIDKISAPFKGYLPIVFAVTIFFSFKMLEFFFVGIAMSLAGIIFFILKAGGILRINKTSVMQESLETAQTKI